MEDEESESEAGAQELTVGEETSSQAMPRTCLIGMYTYQMFHRDI